MSTTQIAALLLALGLLLGAWLLRSGPAASVETGATSPSPAHASPPAETFPVTRTDEEWRQILTPEQYRVLRGHGTEIACSGKFHASHEEGTYFCVGCGNPLFTSAAKFDSGTGWPSYFQPISPTAVGTRQDTSWGMVRTEVHCARCGGHLGHVFPDGPKPTGLRYCINSVCLSFTPAEAANRPK